MWGHLEVTPQYVWPSQKMQLAGSLLQDGQVDGGIRQLTGDKVYAGQHGPAPLDIRPVSEHEPARYAFWSTSMSSIGGPA